MSVYIVNLLIPLEGVFPESDDAIILETRRRILTSYSTIGFQRVEGRRRIDPASFAPYLTIRIETDDTPENRIMEELIGFNEKCIKITAEETIGELINEYFRNQHSFAY
jgi:HSP20 family molecular chaperone IbpA